MIYMSRVCVQQKGKVFGVEAEIEAMHAQSENEEEMAVPLFSFHVHCYVISLSFFSLLFSTSLLSSSSQFIV